MEKRIERLVRNKRALHAQRILSTYLSASVCLLRGDGADEMERCWRDNGASEPVITTLKLIISSRLPEDPIAEIIDRQYWQWFYPLWNEGAFTDKRVLEKARHFEEGIERCLWRSEPLTNNPFYQELKRYFPYVIVAARLRYLRLIHAINVENKNFRDILDDPIGLSEIITSVADTNPGCDSHKPDLLIVGCVRYDRNRDEFEKQPRGVKLEKRFNAIIGKLLNTLDDNNKKGFGYNQHTYLLTQFTIYPIEPTHKLNFLL
ncbi:MAG: hypothetical protein HQL06_16440 [Nitrospirae bacterium]|nr:hypothetical protein [Nitrospirota bacterium]